MITSNVCIRTRSCFSAYLDGAVSGRKMQAIARHLEMCVECTGEFASLRSMQQTLSLLGPARAPSDLALKLRLAISHERSRRQSGWLDGFSMQWQNAVRPLLLQASAGFAGSVVLVGSIMLLLGMAAAPEPVMANDEPLGAMTAPHYLYSQVSPRAITTGQDSVVVSAIIVEAYVNEQGRVYDYNIVSGPIDRAVQSQIVDQLLLSVFEPASVFGSPVRGRVVLTFSGISVQA